MKWIAHEASAQNLKLADHLETDLNLSKTSRLNESYTGKWLLAGEHKRSIRSYLDIHQSVKDRYEADPGYRPAKLVKRLGKPPKWGELVP